MKATLLILCIYTVVLPCTAQIAQRPFPQHVQYTSGTIKPGNYTQLQLDDSTTSFYDQWKAFYLLNNCGAGEYYVWFDENSPNGSICRSEGQGYGMLITAYMAGYDPNAQTYFDGLYNYYKAHPSSINPHLMAWDQITGCINNPQGGDDAATDGDLDAAYALLLADKQWGSTGTINYFSEALTIINAIKLDEINQNIWTTQLSDNSFFGDPDYNDTRTSDFMCNHFRAFQNATNDSNWFDVINECYSLVNTIQTNFSPTTGLLPDFILDCNTTPVPAGPNYLESPYDGHFYYNACRTPLRIAIDYLLAGESQAKIADDKINNWIKIKTNNDPTLIRAGYLLNGNNIPGGNYPSGAFIGPLTVSAMVNNINQTWLNDSYDHLLSLQLPDYEYFDNTLKMLSLIVISGNWWTPSSSTGISNIESSDWNFNVYPNPAHSKFTIEFEYRNVKKDNIQIEIKNVLGEHIYSSPFFEFQKSIKLDFSDQPKGLYFVKIQDGMHVQSKVLVVQ